MFVLYYEDIFCSQTKSGQTKLAIWTAYLPQVVSAQVREQELELENKALKHELKRIQASLARLQSQKPANSNKSTSNYSDDQIGHGSQLFQKVDEKRPAPKPLPDTRPKKRLKETIQPEAERANNTDEKTNPETEQLQGLVKHSF